MSGTWSIVEKATGRIVGTYSASFPDPPSDPDMSFIEGVWDGASYYVGSGGAPAERPSLPGFDKLAIAADGTDTAKLTGLPIPCIVEVDGDPITVEDGELWISSSTAATYVVEVDAFPFLPYRAEVTAA